MVYNQIWLNLPTDGHHYFCLFLWGSPLLPQTNISQTNTGSSVLLLFGTHLYGFVGCWMCVWLYPWYTPRYKSGYVLTLLRALVKNTRWVSFWFLIHVQCTYLDGWSEFQLLTKRKPPDLTRIVWYSYVSIVQLLSCHSFNFSHLFHHLSCNNFGS
jgi:hypothetical protein